MAVDLSTATPLGTDPTNSTPLYQSEWGYLLGEVIPDGVLGDLTGNGWNVTADGASTNVVVKPGGASLAVRGTLGRHDADITLDVAAVGSAPAAADYRRDIVVARLDYTTRKVQVDVIPGTPAPSGATDPFLTRNPVGVWEWPLARITRVGNTAVTQAMIERLAPWAGRHLGQLDDLGLAHDAPMGTTALIGTDLWERAPGGRDAAGLATGVTWWNRTSPAWSSTGWTFATGMTANGTGMTPRFRRVGGRLEAAGQIKRTTGAEFAAHVQFQVGTIPATFAAGMSGTKYAQVATDWAYGCRVHVIPQPAGHAYLYATCPPGTSVIVLDGFSVPS